MTIPAVAIPALVLASEFPTGADRTAGTFNTKSVAWANSENAMATRTREIAEAARLNAVTANQAATEANEDASLATTNGAAQVTLAAEQVTLAAEQVTLATHQKNLTTAQAVIATDKAVLTAADRVQTGLDRTAAESSRIAASKLNLGNKATPPTLDNQGAALLAGATYYDTTLNKWRVWTGSAWGDGISSIAGVASVNGETGNVVLALLRNVTYDNRASLRALNPAAGDAAVVEGLGLFVWQSASTEPDDDESAFATASGVWLLEAVSWDVTAAWNSPDEQAQNDDDEDEPLRFASSFASSFAARVLTGSATCAITSVGASTSIAFTGTVTGAAIGDRVIATPPAQLGNTAADTGRLSYHAWVSAANTVTIMLTNASAVNATTNTAIRANWPVTVIKS
jgi:hypothetical protein